MVLQFKPRDARPERERPALRQVAPVPRPLTRDEITHRKRMLEYQRGLAAASRLRQSAVAMRQSGQ